jgi:hypothetical protein
VSLFPILNQVIYPGAGDTDDCAVVATFWAARAAGYTGSLPTVTAFRAAAGVPDVPGPTGLLNSQVWDGVQGTVLRTLQPRMRALQPWGIFADALQAGEVASVALLSSRLPSTLRYGFMGEHRVGLAWRNRWMIANPLGPDQSAPLPIAEDTLKAAILAHGGGFVYAITFPPLEDSMSIYVRDNRAGRFTIPAGKVVHGYVPVGSVWAVDRIRAATVHATSGPFDYSLLELGGTRVMRHVPSGTFEGQFLDATEVLETFNPVPDPDVKHPLKLTDGAKVLWEGTI